MCINSDWELPSFSITFVSWLVFYHSTCSFDLLPHADHCLIFCTVFTWFVYFILCSVIALYICVHIINLCLSFYFSSPWCNLFDLFKAGRSFQRRYWAAVKVQISKNGGYWETLWWWTRFSRRNNDWMWHRNTEWARAFKWGCSKFQPFGLSLSIDWCLYSSISACYD